MSERTLPDPNGGCACTVNPNPYTYYGIAEPGDSLEYEPACPVHSVHLYDPKAGMWIFRDPVKNAAWETERVSPLDASPPMGEN